jgi:ABC-type Fe3+-siderophore transport system permease subunit
MAADLSPKSSDGARLRAANLRTALAVALIAILFFVGVIAAQFVGDSAIGMSMVAAGVLLFLAFAIGRNLRKPPR